MKRYVTAILFAIAIASPCFVPGLDCRAAGVLVFILAAASNAYHATGWHLERGRP